LEQKPQRKKLGKKETAYCRLAQPAPRHYSWRATFKKVDETIEQSECEHSVQPFNKSKF
jgi:hypothetical protein